MVVFLSGALVMSAWAVGLFFLRFFRETHDRLFLLFALAFWCMALNWLLLAIVDPAHESRVYVYVLRLAANLLIIGAIVDKNRSAAAKP